MKIDRARFLVLTGAISGAIAAASAVEACSVATTSTPDAGGTQQGDSGSGQDATNGTDSGGGTDTGTGSDTATDSPSTCDDSVGTSGACADYADGGTPADAGNGCLNDVVCTGLLNGLKPKVAQNAINCIVTGPACEGAAGTPIADCIAQALGNACADSTGAAACQQIDATCSDAGADAGISSADCQKLTPGMTSAGRTQFVACMTESACFVTDPKQCLQFQ
jgi:hypothetical protein